MDDTLRKLQRDAVTDPDAAILLASHIQRILGSAGSFLSPKPVPEPPPRAPRETNPTHLADRWVWGVKHDAKREKRRANRRLAKEQCRNWEDY